MTDRELNIALREMARSAGLCDQWYNEWKDDSTIDECLDRYVRGFDFAIEKDYPPLDFIRKNFDIEDMHRHDIYLDEKVDILDAESGTYIFLGKCEGNIRFESFSVGTLYVRHDSKITVFANDFAKVFVSVYDDADSGFFERGGAVIKRYDRRK